jgi:hypothetical protein
MIEALAAESLAQWRRDYSTQVNHIVEFGKLLIEEAGERHLDRFIPDFEEIREGGRELLALIENASDQHLGAGMHSEGQAFRSKIRAVALEISRTLDSLAQYPKCDHRQTLADFDAISGAIDHLLQLMGLQRERD